MTDRIQQLELYKPTIAREVPTKWTHGNGFSAMNAFKKAKFAYVSLINQKPCPPRGAVPVNRGQVWGNCFIPTLPDRTSVMAATAQLFAAFCGIAPVRRKQ